MGYSYKENGIKYICKSYIFNNYKMKYELYKQDNMWYALLESYNEDKNIKAVDVFKKKAEQKLMLEFENYVKAGTIDTLIHNGYKIELEYPDVLYSIRDILVGYHISSTSNRQSILSNGIIANGNEDIEVRKASQLIDKYKPWHIPQNIIRENSSYAWPIMTNYTLGSEYKNHDIYAIKFDVLTSSWVGSQGIGGFCLYYDENFSEQLNEQECLKAIKYAKDYWKYSCSLKIYLKNSFWTRHSDKYAGLDEIITNNKINPSVVSLIGHWDNNGIFIEEDNFKNYIKPEFKNSYKEILKKYMHR